MTNKELFLAVSDLFETKLVDKLQPLKDDISVLKSDVSELKSDVSELKSDVSELKSDVDKLKNDVDKLKNDVSKLEIKVNRIDLKIENEICPAIQLLVENYVPAATRYVRSTAKLESIETDVKLLKTVVSEHSEMLQTAL